MDDTPVVLGINRGRHASICLMHGAHVQWSIQKERLTRRRHHPGEPGDVDAVYLPCLSGLERPLDVLVECHAAGDAAAHDAEAGDDRKLAFAHGARRARIPQHLAHVYSAFHPSPFREAAVLVLGSHDDAGPGDDRALATCYRVDRERIACIGQQVAGDGEHLAAGLGMFYFRLTQALFPGAGNEGKVADLAPYGDPQAPGLPPLAVEGMQVTIPQAWQEVLGDTARCRFGAPQASFTDCANLAAAGQRAFEEALLALARWLRLRTGLDDLCLAGGAALNSAANARLLRDGPFRRLFVPPAPGAAGAALGCAIHGLLELAGLSADFRWTHDYLGPAPQLADIEAALDGAPDLIVEHPRGRDALCARMLDLLCSGRVVGLYQGRSEFGPRGLGHRSILADPRRERMRDWINARVKEREWFRPFAPMVAEERAFQYFDLQAPSPFMQFAVPVRSSVMPLLAAVTHVDGSARLQTVGPSDDPVLRALLAGFEVRTGVPVLLGTSLCGRDEPLVETPQEAVATFRRMPLHGLAMPPYLVMKRHEPGLPA
ncbi:carbamoyltransferase C-terminal domain-containing protein [Telluria beijingensis]|uniref:carbamoyltransferase C-terminal domain-containing protein n=1 Tax=Telluria beijingensis TaxID=3068633 RepID=UPI0027955D59|nr:carbamoyltransferase C-terminal domain-containing protein [Massilia sp. REN29]